MDKLEMVERLRERANVSYEEAAKALEEANGDLLDAMVILEKQGKTKAPEQSAYSTSYEEQKEYTPVKDQLIVAEQAQKEKKPRGKIMEESSDGFYIAEEDLKLRGPGDLFGVRQSGELWFDLADIYEDADLLKRAASYADRVLKENPDYQVRTGKQIDFRTI